MGTEHGTHVRHPALLSQYPAHRRWVLIRAFKRQQGLMVHPAIAKGAPEPEALLAKPLRWAMRQEGAGTQRFLQETLARYGVGLETLKVSTVTHSEREAASAISLGLADIVPGAHAAARENGLAFLSTGWECFDLALERGIFFRRLLQDLIACLKSAEAQATRVRHSRADFGPFFGLNDLRINR